MGLVEFTCPKCGHEVQESDDTCGHCGANTLLRTPVQIWKGLTGPQQSALLKLAIRGQARMYGARTVPARNLVRAALATCVEMDLYRLTDLGRAVVEYGRKARA